MIGMLESSRGSLRGLHPLAILWRTLILWSLVISAVYMAAYSVLRSVSACPCCVVHESRSLRRRLRFEEEFQ
jgi:hypothetical protein